MVEVKKIAVVGAGQMGAGIAQVSAMAGYQTLLWDERKMACEKALSGIEKSLGKLVEKGKLSATEAENSKKSLTVVSALEDLKDANLVIEAIIENFDIKAQLFKRLSELSGPETYLASNTSSISITRLASTTKNPQRFVGLHFMNPVPLMQLVEIIRGLQTSDETYQMGLQVIAKMQKIAVRGIDSPGFIVNRVLCPMINEAIFLLQEGVQPEDIDNAMKLGTNQPMGPLTLADFVGLDTLLSILQLFQRELGEDKYRPCPLLIKYVEAGWFGRKSGRGFYMYDG